MVIKQEDHDTPPTVQIGDLEFQSHHGLNDTTLMNSYIKKLSQSEIIAMSGAMSGFLAGVMVCPLDVVKTRLQAQGSSLRSAGNAPKIKKYNGFLSTLKTISKEEGIKGLYRGLVPITVGYLPTWMIYFSVYERAKHFYPNFLSSNFDLNIELLNHFCSAITAGSLSSIATNPIWVVKTRLMLQTGNGKTIYQRYHSPTETKLNNEHYYKNTFDAFKKMYKYDGIRSFYSGLVPSLFGLCHVAVHFPVYEKLKSKLDINNPNISYKLEKLVFASSLSKMIASTLTYPHEILRTRLQINSTEKKKLLTMIKQIYITEGIKGFYSGFFTNLARTVPSSAVTLVSFEYIKAYLENVKYEIL